MTVGEQNPVWLKRAAVSLGWLRSPYVSITIDQMKETGARAIVDRTALDGSNGHIYPEVTGYCLSVLESIIQLGQGSEADVHLAQQTAMFLNEMLRQNGGGVYGSARHRATAQRHYTFDTGMVLKGLAAHAYRTQTPDRGSLRKALAFLGGSIDPNGRIRPFGSMAYTCPEIRWSTRPGPYLLKAILGLACGYSGLHGELVGRAVIERTVLHALRSRNREGMFIVEPDQMVHMHAHLYACEAAYLLGVTFGLAAASDAAYIGVMAALRLCLCDGYLPAFGHIKGVAAERSDTVAQLLRLCLLLGTGSASHHRFLAGRLAKYQHEETGALRFGADYDCRSGLVQPHQSHLSTHATLFAIQAWLGLASNDMVDQWRQRPWTFA